MNYFTNQNRIKLLNERSKECKEGKFKPGEFVRVENGLTCSLGNSFKATPKDIRPMAVNFGNGQEYYNEASDGFNQVKNGHFTQGSYGYEVALETLSQVYILFLCTACLRSISTLLLQSIDKPLLLESNLCTYKDMRWYNIEVWCKASTVKEFLPIYDEEE